MCGLMIIPNSVVFSMAHSNEFILISFIVLTNKNYLDTFDLDVFEVKAGNLNCLFKCTIKTLSNDFKISVLDSLFVPSY